MTKKKVQVRLTPEQKIHTVTALACFVAPHEIRSEMAERWGVKISKQVVECYNPATRAGMSLREELRQHFFQMRREYLASRRRYGIADQTVRLAYLDDIFQRFLAGGNLMAATQVLRQVAEEVGGKYSSVKMPAVPIDARQSLANVRGISVDELPESPQSRRRDW